MAHIRLEPPPPLDFTEADAWPRWKKRFEQFRVASGLCNEDESRQVSTLLYCLGELRSGGGVAGNSYLS